MLSRRPGSQAWPWLRFSELAGARTMMTKQSIFRGRQARVLIPQRAQG